MANFDWRTDEDKGWEEPVAEGQAAVEQSGAGRGALRLLRRRWRTMLALVLIAGAIGVLGARSLTLRVQAAEAAAREEVLAVHSVVLEAARTKDAELYLTMLGGDRAWRQSQLDMLIHNALFERRALGLAWQKEVDAANEVTLSPDLQQATITSTLRYEGYAGGGAREAVNLQHLFRYERDAAQWRLAPQEEDSWGGWSTGTNERVMTVFPGRDELIGVRLTEDFQHFVERACDNHIACPPQLHVQVRLERNVETLHTPTYWFDGAMPVNLTLGLPAPSLVGLPADETGYRALRTAYYRIIVTQLFDTLARDVGGASGSLHDARQRMIFADLDLLPWPPQGVDGLEADGDVLVLCATQTASGADLWRYDAQNQSWHSELAGRDLLQMAALNGAPGVLLREQHETLRRTTEPKPDVIWWGEGRELAIFESYYLGDSQPNSPAFTAASLDGQSHWIYLGAAADCDGRGCSDIEMRQDLTVWSPDGQHTLLHRQQEGSRSPPAGDVVLWLGDSRGEPLQQLGEGYNPFWIDEATFGYLLILEGSRQSFPPEYELVLRRVDEGDVGNAETLPLDLVAALQAVNAGSGDRLEMGIGISHILAHPSRPHTVYLFGVPFSWLVSSFATPERSSYMFTINTQSGDIAVHSPGGPFIAHDRPRMSSDGRWLAVRGYHTVEEQGVVAVYDLNGDPASGPVYHHLLQDSVPGPSWLPDSSPPYDWSADGQLLILAGGILTILDAQEWQPQQLVPPTAGCAHAAWAD